MLTSRGSVAPVKSPAVRAAHPSSGNFIAVTSGENVLSYEVIESKMIAAPNSTINVNLAQRCALE